MQNNQEAQKLPVDEEALARARILQRKRDEGRQQASKAQLKKARRKLSKLYHKALGLEDPSSKPSAGAHHADVVHKLQEPAPHVHATLTESFSACSQPTSQHSTLFPPEPACSSMGGTASHSEHTSVHPTAPRLQDATAGKSRAPHALPLASDTRKKSRHARMGAATCLQGPMQAPPQGQDLPGCDNNGGGGGGGGGGALQPDQNAMPEASESSVRGHATTAMGDARAQGRHPHPGALQGHPGAPAGQADLSRMLRLLQAELPPPAALTALSTDSGNPASSQQQAASTVSPHQQGEERHQAEVRGQADFGQEQGLPQQQQHSYHQQKRQRVSQPVQQQQQQQQQGQQQQQQQGQQKPQQQGPRGQQPQKKKPLKTYIYGNYHGYYGYRHTAAFEDDPRLCLLRPEWFEGRHMLDVGCNEGLVTLAVAAQFNCASTTGVDIDRDLISKACRNLRQMRTDVAEQIREAGAGISKPTIPASLAHPQPQSASGARSGSRSATPTRNVGVVQTRQHHHHLHHHEHQQQQHHQQLQVVGSNQSPSDSLVSGGVGVQGAANAGAIPHAAGPETHAHVHGTGGCSGAVPGNDGGPITADEKAAKKSPGLLSPWERLRRAAHVLSRAQFKTCDWANEGDPDDFVLSQGGKSSKRRRGRDRYGVITCLSVTKWVHLNWGDAGLMRLFTKIWNSLEPGGLLVLEPQPWRSYCQAITKKQTSAVPFRNLEALRLRPEAFIDTLTNMGFQLLVNLNEGSTAIGFSRPMYVLLKPSSPSPSIRSTAVVELTGQQQQPQQQLQSSPSGAASLEGQQGKRRRQGKSSKGSLAASASDSQQTGKTCSKSSSRSRDHRRQPQPEDLLELPDDDEEEEDA